MTKAQQKLTDFCPRKPFSKNRTISKPDKQKKWTCSCMVQTPTKKPFQKYNKLKATIRITLSIINQLLRLLLLRYTTNNKIIIIITRRQYQLPSPRKSTPTKPQTKVSRPTVNE